ncbi:transposase [Flammeovirgaceae bacterium 311]|nr:transposase [Flammeovirgaceae bacterium 311]
MRSKNNFSIVVLIDNHGDSDMPQSLTKNYVHIIFSSKNREPFLHSPVKEELWDCLGGMCKALECNPIHIGGYHDHVHVLCLLSKKLALMKLVEEIKTHSSKWLKAKGSEFSGFSWHLGYGAFSVNPAQWEAVAAHIEKQEEHHQEKSFQAEFRTILGKYKMDYDEHYLWD